MFQNDFLSDIGIRKLLQSRQSLFEGTAYIEIAHNGLSGTVLCQMSYCLKKEIKKNQSVGEISEVFRFSWFRVLIMISYRNCERRYYNGACDLWGKSYKSGNEEEFGVDVFYNCLSRRNHFAMRWLVGAPPVGDIRCHKKVNWISDTSKVKSRYLVWYNNFDLTCDFWIINEVSSLKWIVKRI